MNIEFEWDPDKAEINRKKHGVSFEIACRVFADPFALVEQDRIERGEYRWQTLGMVEGCFAIACRTYSEGRRQNGNHPDYFSTTRQSEGKETI